MQFGTTASYFTYLYAFCIVGKVVEHTRNFCRVSLILYSDKSLVRKEYFYSDMKGIITLKLSSKMFESSAFSFILQSFSLS